MDSEVIALQGGKRPLRFDAAIESRRGRTFSVIDLPTSPDVGGASSKGLLSGSGTWRLDKDENGFSIWVINLDFMNHHRETVHLRRQTPPYVMHIFIGDPDSGGAVLLERAP